MRRLFRHSPDPTPAGPFEEAAARFNASEAGRTVAGLCRTLGTPRVSVGACAGSPKVLRVTVAWELSWYQWQVDLGAGAVAELAKGTDVAELDAAARHWNATAGEDGRVALTTRPRPPAPVAAVR